MCSILGYRRVDSRIRLQGEAGLASWMAEHLNRQGMLRAGYAIEYETPAEFQFITVQGAGHLVPTFKPHFALTMITKFLKNDHFRLSRCL